MDTDYNSRLIEACYQADLDNPTEAEHLARIVAPKLESTIRLLGLCRTERDKREAERIEKALAIYRQRLLLERAA